ncbi:MAG: hypothetical protein HQL68_02240 [Magnetococcales bacterium]|nr:hypothetical protein [Magnetococcales bacterium]
MATPAELIAAIDAKVDAIVQTITDSLSSATTAVAGLIKLATPAETIAGVVADKAITPACLGTTIADTTQSVVDSALTGAGLYLSILNKSADYTMLVEDAGGLINVDTSGGAVTITLEDSTAFAEDGEITIAKTTDDANAVTILAAGTDTVDGGASVSITTKSSLKISLNQATGAWTAAAPVPGAMQNLSDDTTPELSGPLVGNDNTVSGVNHKDTGVVTNAIGSGGGGTVNIDLTAGNSVTLTIDTATTTLAFLNPTAAPNLCMFNLTITNGGSQTVNFPVSSTFIGGDPTLTVAGNDEFLIFTKDGGTSWLIQTIGLDV